MHARLRLITISLVTVIAACAGEGEITRSEASTAATSAADGPDLCLRGGFYNDGLFCDGYCPEFDGDCACDADACLPLFSNDSEEGCPQQCIDGACQPIDASCAGSVALTEVHTIDEAEFQRVVLDASQPVLVGFLGTEELCGPCIPVKEYMTDLAKVRSNDIKFVQISVAMDSDNNVPVFQTYEIASVPEFLIFQNGEPTHRLAGGVLNKAELEDFIDRSLE